VIKKTINSKNFYLKFCVSKCLPNADVESISQAVIFIFLLFFLNIFLAKFSNQQKSPFQSFELQ